MRLLSRPPPPRPPPLLPHQTMRLCLRSHRATHARLTGYV
jgi:hypothetical protein